MLKDLSLRYDSMTIQDIESGAIGALTTAERNRRLFVEALYYLRHTGRWKENKQYAKATFREYLQGLFMMTEATFERERIAYISFPEATEKFGPGVVSKSISRIGSIKTGKILNSLPKGTSLKRIEQRIEEEAPVRTPSQPVDIPTKPQLSSQIDRLRDEIRARDRLIADQQEQIRKLKEAVQKYKKMQSGAHLSCRRIGSEPAAH